MMMMMISSKAQKGKTRGGGEKIYPCVVITTNNDLKCKFVLFRLRF